MSDSVQEPQQDPFGRVMDLRYALADEGLTVAGTDAETEESRRAAYCLAVALGQCRIEGIDPGEWDGSLPAPVAAAAARRLITLMARRIQNAVRLEQTLNEDDCWSLPEPCFELIEGRMQTWATFVAIDEAYQVSLEELSDACSYLRPLMDEILDRIEELDDRMMEQLDLLTLVVDFPYLDNVRSLLAGEYSKCLPWWLDGRIEQRAEQLAADVEWLPRRLYKNESGESIVN